MRWLVADSLYCPEAFFASHLDSYSHYLREYGELVERIDLSGWIKPSTDYGGGRNIGFFLDRYQEALHADFSKRIAQVAAICNPMPWDVRKADGTPAYDLVISSIPWMVDEARAKGCRAEYQPLAFDARARVCGMGVSRDLGAIFIGTVGPNHKKRASVLEELKDVVTVLPPVFGREYFKTLARAKVVVNIHAEWARGAANNMRMFEAAGMGAVLISDGNATEGISVSDIGFQFDDRTRARILDEDNHDSCLIEDVGTLIKHHTYESRIPQLVEWARSL